MKQFMTVFTLFAMSMFAFGCTSIATQPQTTGQAYLAVKYDYSIALEAATDYVNLCRDAPTKECLELSKKIQSTDKKIGLLLQLGDATLREDDNAPKLESYKEQINELLDELRSYAVEKGSDV